MIAAAERAGWPRFIDHDDEREDRERPIGLEPGDVDQISTRTVVASDGSNVRGRLSMVIGQIARYAVDGSVIVNSVSCSVMFTPRSSAVALVADGAGRDRYPMD